MMKYTPALMSICLLLPSVSFCSPQKKLSIQVLNQSQATTAHHSPQSTAPSAVTPQASSPQVRNLGEILLGLSGLGLRAQARPKEIYQALAHAQQAQRYPQHKERALQRCKQLQQRLELFNKELKTVDVVDEAAQALVLLKQPTTPEDEPARKRSRKR